MRAGHLTRPFVLFLFLLFARASARAAQHVTQLRAAHRAGQTILTWKEVSPPVTQEAIKVRELRRIRRELDKTRRIRYRIYRAAKPVRSLDGLTTRARHTGAAAARGSGEGGRRRVPTWSDSTADRCEAGRRGRGTSWR